MLKSFWSWILISLGLKSYAQDFVMLPLDSARSVRHYLNFPSKFVDPRNVDIYVPMDYDSTKKYRLLLMQDGQNLFSEELAFQHEPLGLDEVLIRNEIHDVVVVAIWNTAKRFREYLPDEIYSSLHRRDKKFIRKEYGGEPKGNLYCQFITKELMPFLMKHYSISDLPEDHIIGGISMGALISFFIAIKYPEYFGASLCISTHWPLSVIRNKKSIPESYHEVIQQYFNKLTSGKFYFDYGTENIDGWYATYQNVINALFLERNKAGSRFQFHSEVFKDAGHSMKDWKSRIDIPVQFMLKKD